MTGAVPNTEWLEDCLALDNKGFIITGHDLENGNGEDRNGRDTRSPYLLETSLPGVFAAGDVRVGQREARSVGGR